LNRARALTSADREAAERVGTLITGLNGSNSRWSEFKKAWIPRSANADTKFPDFKSLKESTPYYGFEVDLFPYGDGVKWRLIVNCSSAPSGEGKGLCARFDDLENQDSICSPELLAVEAVIHSALEGRLGTIKQCQVGSCNKWFISRDDSRRRCCPDHNADDLRKGTPKRRKQIVAAAKGARERAKSADEKHKARSAKAGRSIPGRHRAND